MTIMTNSKTKFKIGEKIQSDVGEVEVRGIQAHEEPASYLVRDANNATTWLSESQTYTKKEYEEKLERQAESDAKVRADAQGQGDTAAVDLTQGEATVGAGKEGKTSDGETVALTDESGAGTSESSAGDTVTRKDTKVGDGTSGVQTKSVEGVLDN